MRTVHSSLFKLIQFIRFNHVIQFVHASGRCHAMSLSFCTILFSSFHVMSFHPFHTIPFHSAAPLHSIPFHSPVHSLIPSFNHSANLVWLNLHSFQLNSIQTQSSDHWGLFSPVHSISVFLCSFILLSFSFEFHLQYLHVALCHSFIHSFSQSVSQSFIHSFIHLFIHLFIRSFVHSFVHSSIHSVVGPDYLPIGTLLTVAVWQHLCSAFDALWLPKYVHWLFVKSYAKSATDLQHILAITQTAA